MSWSENPKSGACRYSRCNSIEVAANGGRKWSRGPAVFLVAFHTARKGCGWKYTSDHCTPWTTWWAWRSSSFAWCLWCAPQTWTSKLQRRTHPNACASGFPFGPPCSCCGSLSRESPRPALRSDSVLAWFALNRAPPSARGSAGLKAPARVSTHVPRLPGLSASFAASRIPDRSRHHLGRFLCRESTWSWTY